MVSRPAIANDVTCLIAELKDIDSSNRYSVEEDCVRYAVDTRRNEFHAGRALARKALAEIGFEPGPLPAGNNRMPIWPPDVVGSISHSKRFVGVAVSVSDTIHSLGLDIELRYSVEPSLYPSILLPQEQEELETRAIDPTVYFSCKEALFKAVFPIHKEYFDFVDVELAISTERFAVRSLNPDLSSNPTISLARGFHHRHLDHMISLCVIPADSSTSKADFAA